MCIIRKAGRSSAMAATLQCSETSNSDKVENHIENRIKNGDAIKSCEATDQNDVAEDVSDSSSLSRINKCQENEKSLSDSHNYTNGKINLKCSSLNRESLTNGKESVSENKDSNQFIRESENEKNNLSENVDDFERHGDDDYFKPLKKLKMIQNISANIHPSSTIQHENKTSTSQRIKTFSISEILSTNSSKSEPLNEEKTINPLALYASSSSRFIRPWDTDEEDLQENMSVSSSSSSCSPRPASSGPVLEPSTRDVTLSPHIKGGGTPLDALFKMTSNTFLGLKNSESGDSANQTPLFSNKQSFKKKRKSRTAFTNHQIFELEKRFLYQKYLSPVDRDEIAQGLGLSNAQVITWFQNRRAKLKRDLEELKSDARTASLLGNHSVFIQTISRMGLLKTKSDMELSFINCKK
ncbi:UNVERIFIED_CONTAM: hypothetical protein RMT77_001544 [Armadillidium vulgare]